MEILADLRKSGFRVSLNEQNNIVISPVSKLSQKQRELIIENKEDLVFELKTYRYWHVTNL